MAEFIKAGNRIVNKPNGLDYDLVKGKVYDLEYDRMEGLSYLKENGDLNMPKKVYQIEKDIKFIDRVLKYFNSEKSSQTIGVLLSGTKGTGKTVLSKQLAMKSNLPIIVVSSNYPVSVMSEFFKKCNTEVCIIFDEIEKNKNYWRTDDLLGFLDGVQFTCKKMVIMTCNSFGELNDNLFDRCSRVRYHRKYTDNSNVEFIREIAKDKGIRNIDAVTSFIVDYMMLKSFDNISSFLDEILLNEDLTLEEVAENMNITLNKVKNAITNNTTVSAETISDAMAVAISNDDFEDDDYIDVDSNTIF